VAYGPLGVDLRLGWRRTAGRQGCPAAGPCGARLERLLRLEGWRREGYGRRGWLGEQGQGQRRVEEGGFGPRSAWPELATAGPLGAGARLGCGWGGLVRRGRRTAALL
jgi:hypothetical protein